MNIEKKVNARVNKTKSLDENLFLIETSLSLIGRDNNVCFLKSSANLSHRLVNLKPAI